MYSIKNLFKIDFPDLNNDSTIENTYNVYFFVIYFFLYFLTFLL